jgi:hypothetical protein
VHWASSGAHEVEERKQANNAPAAITDVIAAGQSWRLGSQATLRL